MTVSLWRLFWLLAFWAVLDGVDTAGLVVGVIAAWGAALLSVRLLRAPGWQFRPIGLALFALRFVQQSVIAGVEVAWLAFAPGAELHPGFIAAPTRLPNGLARDLFRMISSLMPGSLPCGTEQSGATIVHVLDNSRAAVAALADEERRFADAFGMKLQDG